jgi:hypothetical protein
MQLTTGKQPAPVKAVLYGPEGIGKTTFASRWPKPLFVDCEGGSGQLDVTRTWAPTSWAMLKGIVQELTKDALGFQTLVIDTADWADKLAAADVCASNSKASLADFGWAQGWIKLAEEWAKMLDSLTLLQQRQGMNVLFLGHAVMRKIDLPEETGSYDHWELKTEKRSAALLKEWVDLMLFANYKTMVVEIDGKKKAQGGQRVMYTTHHSCWDAKNRFGLKEELPLDFAKIAHILQQPSTPVPAPQAAPQAPALQPDSVTPPPIQQALQSAEVKAPPVQDQPGRVEGITDALWNLMTMSGVTEEEIRKASAVCKYFTLDTPIANYPPEYISGKLVANWAKVNELIVKLRSK